ELVLEGPDTIAIASDAHREVSDEHPHDEADAEAPQEGFPAITPEAIGGRLVFVVFPSELGGSGHRGSRGAGLEWPCEGVPRGRQGRGGWHAGLRWLAEVEFERCVEGQPTRGRARREGSGRDAAGRGRGGAR